MSAMHRVSTWLIVGALSISSAAYAASPGGAVIKVKLSGSEEVPPATTSASGIGVIAVAADKTITASVTTSGVVVTVAHIHEGPPGKNGPIIIPLVQSSESIWSAPPGVKLTDAQYESYMAGNLYFNMHSATYRGGEVRGQIKP